MSRGTPSSENTKADYVEKYSEMPSSRISNWSLQKAKSGLGRFMLRYPAGDQLCKKYQFFRKHVYLILEVPDSGLVAMVISMFIMCAISVSVLSFVVETMPEFHMIPSSVWEGIETCTSVIFTVELIIRLWVIGVVPEYDLRNFVSNIMNWFDVLSIIPFYLEKAISSVTVDLIALRVLRVVRLTRVFRVMKLSRYSLGMRLMGEGLRRSIQALWILVFFLAIGVILFSSALYYAENHFSASRFFPSIPATFWWAVVTMTTVGYGDVYPETGFGKLIATMAMLSGILLIALPVAIIGNKFQEVYIQMEEENTQSVRRRDMFKHAVSIEDPEERLNTKLLIAAGRRSSGDSSMNIDRLSSPKLSNVDQDESRSFAREGGQTTPPTIYDSDTNHSPAVLEQEANHSSFFPDSVKMSSLILVADECPSLQPKQLLYTHENNHQPDALPTPQVMPDTAATDPLCRGTAKTRKHDVNMVSSNSCSVDLAQELFAVRRELKNLQRLETRLSEQLASAKVIEEELKVLLEEVVGKHSDGTVDSGD